MEQVRPHRVGGASPGPGIAGSSAPARRQGACALSARAVLAARERAQPVGRAGRLPVRHGNLGGCSGHGRFGGTGEVALIYIIRYLSY